MDDSENKKERIFLATLTLISENGFHGTPVSLIAQVRAATEAELAVSDRLSTMVL